MTPDVDVDREVPALLLKVGQYPIHSGGLGVIRTLGRLGIGVYAITEPGLTPAAASRYCTEAFTWRATGQENQDDLIAGLRAAGRQIGRPAVVVPVDDESAVLVAENQAELAGQFLFPPVRAGLPRELASKPGLFELCAKHGFPAPASVAPRSMAEVAEFAATATYPLVVKNAEVWERRQRPVVPGTTAVRTEGELLGAAARFCLTASRPGCSCRSTCRQSTRRTGSCTCTATPSLAAGCSAPGSRPARGRPNAGVTACAYSISNPGLAALAADFCAKIDFVGVADLDVRLDLRDGQYKLVDFNPRAGNQFRLFETRAGIDVVRALHLDLTGRPIPRAPQVEGRRIIVEHADRPGQVRLPAAGPACGPGPGDAPRAHGHRVCLAG